MWGSSTLWRKISTIVWVSKLSDGLLKSITFDGVTKYLIAFLRFNIGGGSRVPTASQQHGLTWSMGTLKVE